MTRIIFDQSNAYTRTVRVRRQGLICNSDSTSNSNSNTGQMEAPFQPRNFFLTASTFVSGFIGKVRYQFLPLTLFASLSFENQCKFMTSSSTSHCHQACL